MPARSSSPKGRGCHSDVVSVSTLGWLEVIQAVSWSHLKIGSKANAKRKPLAGQPCRLPLAQGSVVVLFREFLVRGVVVFNTSWEAADKFRQFCFLEHSKDPGVIDAGIGSSKICQKNA